MAEAHANPGVLATKTIGQVADHFATVIARLQRNPAVNHGWREVAGTALAFVRRFALPEAHESADLFGDEEAERRVVA